MTNVTTAQQIPYCYDEDVYGRIIMTGRDSAALLQRLTTNDVLALQSNQRHANGTYYADWAHH
jgi:folate-binding Fe-S cluster repair protein YgfZ